MKKKDTVRQFLKEFKEAMHLWQVFFRNDRGKNIQALAELEIRSVDREKVLDNLEVQDYSEGPLEDTIYHHGDIWVFGKEVKKKEIYI